MMSHAADYRDPRLSRTNSNSSDTNKRPSASPSRGDPRLRTQDPPHQHWPPHQQLPHMAQMPQTHYTIGDGMTTYQHLVPNAAATVMYPPAGIAAAAAVAAAPSPYHQYSGYATAAYQSAAYAHPAYAAYYTPAPPPQHIEQHATSYQHQHQQPPAVVAQAETYAPHGAPHGSWAPARMSEQMPVQMQTPITAYMQQQQQPPSQQQQQQQAMSSGVTVMPPSPDITSSTSKQEGVEQEMQQTQSEMRRQRDDYERRAAALSHELDQLKRQKRELKQNGGGGDRQTAAILKDNGKLQAEIQGKLKEYVNVVDILTGILGDQKKGGKDRDRDRERERERDRNRDREHRSRERQHRTRGRSKDSRDKSRDNKSAGGESTSSSTSSASSSTTSSHRSDANNTTTTTTNTNTTTTNNNNNNKASNELVVDANAPVQYNYVHYDPEVHWCRICDAFPRTAKDLLQHLHDDEHRQLMQAENIDIPWHKLPTQDKEFPHHDGATKRRVPIKGLQFFVSAPAWYCRLCDVWIGDLHCASQHLKSVGHSQNFANFVDQNPHWETEWLEDRKRALERVSKNLVKEDKVSSVLDLVGLEKKAKTLASLSSMHLDQDKRDKNSNKLKKKLKKKAKKAKKQTNDSDESSSQSSSSSSEEEESSSENGDGDNVDKSKSIRVTMRNQVSKSSNVLVDEQILILENLVKEKKRLQQQQLELTELQTKATAAATETTTTETTTTTDSKIQVSAVEDRLISQWMNVDVDKSGSVGEKDKYLLDSLKDRLRQKHEAEQRARLIKQQQVIDEEANRRRVEQEKEQMELTEKRERMKQRERELAAEGVHSSNREQVKFRQFRGGRAPQRRRSSTSASPPPPRTTQTTLLSSSSLTYINNSSSSSNKYLVGRSRSRSRSRSTSKDHQRQGHKRDERRRREGTSHHQHHRKERGRDPQRHITASRSRTRTRSRSNSSTTRFTNLLQQRKSDTENIAMVAVVAVVANTTSSPIVAKKLPFIGRMPLFKNRKSSEDQHGTAAVVMKAKVSANSGYTDNNRQLSGDGKDNGGGGIDGIDNDDDYEMPRQSRFQPGNLARAFIPQPDVVHYPKLTTQPTAAVPAIAPAPVAPPPPPTPPPPPQPQHHVLVEDVLPDVSVPSSSDLLLIQQQQHQYGMHHREDEPQQQQQEVYEYTEAEFASISGEDQDNQLELPVLPLLPPPPPKLHFSLKDGAVFNVEQDDDDLAMLGISSDDMAAQVF